MPIAAVMKRIRRSCAWALAALPLLAVGCSTTADPHFNPYAAPGGDPPLLQRGDAAMDGVEQALDNLDRRLENALY